MKIRTQIPKNNKYYNRKAVGGLNGAVQGYPTVVGADVLANCVGYANGRFNEIINDPELKGIEIAFRYQLVCNAENFIESAKQQGLKISSEPTIGGIMVWQKGATLGGGDGAGHVAIVEQIYSDGSIYTSESGWGSLDWSFKNIRRNNSNGRWGQAAAYKFRGCIINPAIGGGKQVQPVPKLTVDGIGGVATVMAMQQYFKMPTIDGVISGQNKSLHKFYPSLQSVSFGSGGSATVKALQKWVGVAQDGILGEGTVKAWQRKLHSLGYDAGTVDGIFGTKSMKAYQECLNNDCKAKANVTRYKFIDVSDWQGKIDWKKVKADGVVGAIIRYADGATLDKRFDENMKGAKAAGLHIGAYIYSRATTKAEAESEATRLYNACKAYSPDMPLYIDLEQKGLESYANTVAAAFTNKIKALGGYSGVYANLNWWNKYLTKVTPQARWVAQYYDHCEYKGGVGMWQYSSSGSVDGISGRVDMDWCYVDYWNKIKPSPTPTPGKKSYSGTYPSYRIVKTNAEVIADTIAWLRMIANNNNFHYGCGQAAHRNGCYFCKTQPARKKNAGIKMWETTYCCNPFVHAGWAHGGCVPKALAICRNGSSWSFDTGSGTYHSSPLFDNLGKVAKSNLKVGDVLCSDEHVAIYAGGGKVLQAGHEDNNVKNSSSWNSSISLSTWNGYTRVYRYNSSVNADMSIFYGEMSDRVKHVWEYMNWYFDNKVGTPQRYYGDVIMGYVKRFQKENGLTVDGIVGPKTIEKMKTIKK